MDKVAGPHEGAAQALTAFGRSSSAHQERVAPPSYTALSGSRMGSLAMAFPMDILIFVLSYLSLDPMRMDVVNPRSLPAELPQGHAFEHVTEGPAYRDEQRI